MTKGEVDLINDKMDTLYKRMEEAESKLKMIECTHHPRNIDYTLDTRRSISSLIYTKQCKLCGKVLGHFTHETYLIDRKQFLEQELEEIDKEIDYDQAKD